LLKKALPWQLNVAKASIGFVHGIKKCLGYWIWCLLVWFRGVCYSEYGIL